MDNLNSFYRGVVVQQLSYGFCKILIPGILDFKDDNGNILVDKIPPAECATSNFGGGLNDGVFVYPEIDSSVWCFFENGNPNKPIYFASSTNSGMFWNSKEVSIPENTDIKGYELSPVLASGKKNVIGNTSISQTNSINPNTKEVVNSKIELKVDYSKEELIKKAEKLDQDKERAKEHRVMDSAVKILLDNVENKISLTADSVIELNAPTIILNSRNMGQAGKVMIISDDIVLESTQETLLINESLTNQSSVMVFIKTPSDAIIYE